MAFADQEIANTYSEVLGMAFHPAQVTEKADSKAGPEMASRLVLGIPTSSSVASVFRSVQVIQTAVDH